MAVMEPLDASDPKSVGPYRTIANLGEGGMGRVLLAGAPDGRLVAVKLVHQRFARDEEFRMRFRREATASRRVSGAYTAAIVGADTDDAQMPWLASVFVPGPSLGQVVADLGALPAETVRRLAAGLSTALVEIHGARLVHRDLTPANVLIAADGLKVIDFGIARAMDGVTHPTQTGWVVGAPGFMSPEQALGERVGPASDVFSLGVVLVLASTGKQPFAGAAVPQILYNLIHTEPDLDTVPAALRPIVRRCLVKDPAARPTPAELLESIGYVPPAAKPWPTAVHRLIEAQQAEVDQYLGPAERPREPTTKVQPPSDHRATGAARFVIRYPISIRVLLVTIGLMCGGWGIYAIATADFSAGWKAIGGGLSGLILMAALLYYANKKENCGSPRRGWWPPITPVPRRSTGRRWPVSRSGPVSTRRPSPGTSWPARRAFRSVRPRQR
jgi:serine/threonine protein kinase